MKTAANIMKYLYFTLMMSVAVLLSRISGGKVLFAPVFSGNKAIIMRDLRLNGAIGLRAVAPKLDQTPDHPIRRLTTATLHILLRFANRGRLDFLIWGYSDTVRLGVDLRELGCGVEYLEAGLLGLQEDRGGDLVSFTRDFQRQYFDGWGRSDLEDLLNDLRSGWWRDDPELSAFESIARRSGQQKYPEIDSAPEFSLTPDDVLVIGQVHGDAAWKYRITEVADNCDLVRSAVRDFGRNRNVFYKPHPFNSINAEQIETLQRENIPFHLISDAVSFRKLAEMKPLVVVNTSGAGLEAAFLGCEVVAYGASYYAGWGATRDQFPVIERRRNRLSAEDIYVATMALYCRYFFRSNLAKASVRDLSQRLASAA